MAAVWDDRLMTRERALKLAGARELRLTRDPKDGVLVILCGECDDSAGGRSGSIGKFPAIYPISVEDILSAVIRHLVVRHSASLSGASEASHG